MFLILIVFQGFFSIVALLGGAVTSAVAMYQVNESAGYIMAPYLAWLSYATALAYSIWRNNPDGGKVYPVEDKKK
jgi:tryptophan-rich sensory protein